MQQVLAVAATALEIIIITISISSLVFVLYYEFYIKKNKLTQFTALLLIVFIFRAAEIIFVTVYKGLTNPISGIINDSYCVAVWAGLLIPQFSCYLLFICLRTLPFVRSSNPKIEKILIPVAVLTIILFPLAYIPFDDPTISYFIILAAGALLVVQDVFYLSYFALSKIGKNSTSPLYVKFKILQRYGMVCCCMSLLVLIIQVLHELFTSSTILVVVMDMLREMFLSVVFSTLLIMKYRLDVSSGMSMLLKSSKVKHEVAKLKQMEYNKA